MFNHLGALWLKGSDDVPAESVVTLANGYRRAVDALGWDRVPHDVTDLRTYVERAYSGKQSASASNTDETSGQLAAEQIEER
jgi:hypothetical protein